MSSETLVWEKKASLTPSLTSTPGVDIMTKSVKTTGSVLGSTGGAMALKANSHVTVSRARETLRDKLTLGILDKFR